MRPKNVCGVAASQPRFGFIGLMTTACRMPIEQNPLTEEQASEFIVVVLPDAMRWKRKIGWRKVNLGGRYVETESFGNMQRNTKIIVLRVASSFSEAWLTESGRGCLRPSSLLLHQEMDR